MNRRCSANEREDADVEERERAGERRGRVMKGWDGMLELEEEEKGIRRLVRDGQGQQRPQKGKGGGAASAPPAGVGEAARQMPTSTRLSEAHHRQWRSTADHSHAGGKKNRRQANGVGEADALTGTLLTCAFVPTSEELLH